MNKLWQKAAKTLKKGGVVIIPSDSSYGLAALASNKQAVERLYQIKGRARGKPSLVIVGSVEVAHELVEFTPLAESLVNKFWPGGLTVVLKARNLKLAPEIYGGDKTLALRWPAKKELQWLAGEVGLFILPSANLAGQPAPFQKEELDQQFIKLVDFVLDEPTGGHPVSTLVDARGEKPMILRQGAVKWAGKKKK